MPISATFQADFSSFKAAVEGAQTQLKNFEGDAKKVATSMTAMENSISGVKIVQAATVAAEAVERLGGVSKLTYGELQRLGGTAQEAVEKMRALGQAVPTNIQSLADQASKATRATTDWGSALSTATGYLSALGINATVSGVVAFTKSVFDNASAIHDMAERLGISAEAVQGFKFAAEQAGSSMDAVGTAITKMNKNLAEGDKSTIAALKQAGLEFQTIRNLSPEDAFLAIADAIAEMPDPMEQSDVALQLFGKSAAELLPAIKEGFRAASESASKMSNETINALERAQDAWEQFGHQVTIISGTILADTIGFAQQATKNLGGFSQFLLDVISIGPGAAMAVQAMNAQLEGTVAFVGPMENMARAHRGTKESADEAAGALKREKDAEEALAKAAKEYADLLKDVAKIEKDTRGESERGLLGLSKLQQEQSQKRFEAESRGLDAIAKAQVDSDDQMARSTLSSTDYQIRKVNEAAQAKIAAFKGTADQAAQYAEIVMAQAAREADAIAASASRALDTVAAKANSMTALINQAAQQAQAGMAVDVVANARAAGYAPASSSPQGFGTSRYVNGVDTWAVGSGVRQFAQGGVGDFGSGTLAMLHGKEAIVPLNGTGVGATTVIINVTQPLGTPAQIADVVGKAVMQNLRQQGTRLPSGA